MYKRQVHWELTGTRYAHKHEFVFTAYRPPGERIPACYARSYIRGIELVHGFSGLLFTVGEVAGVLGRGRAAEGALGADRASLASCVD